MLSSIDLIITRDHPPRVGGALACDSDAVELTVVRDVAVVVTAGPHTVLLGIYRPLVVSLYISVADHCNRLVGRRTILLEMAGDESSVDYGWRNIGGAKRLAGCRLRCIDIHLQLLKYDDVDNLCPPVCISLPLCDCHTRSCAIRSLRSLFVSK